MLCVRAEVVRISVGMLGLYRLFFICADGKKTALFGVCRTFVITADLIEETKTSDPSKTQFLIKIAKPQVKAKQVWDPG